MCLVLERKHASASSQLALLAESCLAAAGEVPSLHYVSACALLGVWLGMRGDAYRAQLYVGRAWTSMAALRVSPTSNGLGSAVLFLRSMWCPQLGWIPPRPSSSVGQLTKDGIAPPRDAPNPLLASVRFWSRPSAEDPASVSGLVLSRAILSLAGRDPFSMGSGTADSDDAFSSHSSSSAANATPSHSGASSSPSRSKLNSGSDSCRDRAVASKPECLAARTYGRIAEVVGSISALLMHSRTGTLRPELWPVVEASVDQLAGVLRMQGQQQLLASNQTNPMMLLAMFHLETLGACVKGKSDEATASCIACVAAFGRLANRTPVSPHVCFVARSILLLLLRFRSEGVRIPSVDEVSNVLGGSSQMSSRWSARQHAISLNSNPSGLVGNLEAPAMHVGLASLPRSWTPVRSTASSSSRPYARGSSGRDVGTWWEALLWCILCSQARVASACMDQLRATVDEAGSRGWVVPHMASLLAEDFEKSTAAAASGSRIAFVGDKRTPAALCDAEAAVQSKGPVPCLLEPVRSNPVLVVPSLAPIADTAPARVLPLMQPRVMEMSQRSILSAVTDAPAGHWAGGGSAIRTAGGVHPEIGGSGAAPSRGSDLADKKARQEQNWKLEQELMSSAAESLLAGVDQDKTTPLVQTAGTRWPTSNEPSPQALRQSGGG